MEAAANLVDHSKPDRNGGFLSYILFGTVLRTLIQTGLLVLLLRAAPWIAATIQPQWTQATKLFLLVTVPLSTILVLFHKTRAIAGLGLAISSLVGQGALLIGCLIVVTSLTQPVWIVLGLWLWAGLGLGLWIGSLWQLSSWEDFFLKTRTLRSAFYSLGLVAVTIGAAALKGRWDIGGPLLLGFTGCLMLSAVMTKVQWQIYSDRIADFKSAATAYPTGNP